MRRCTIILIPNIILESDVRYNINIISQNILSRYFMQNHDTASSFLEILFRTIIDIRSW